MISRFFKTIWRFLTAPFRWVSNLFKRAYIFFTEDPEDAPLPDAFAKAVQQPAGLLEHIDALRKHLFRAVVVMFIATGAAFAFIQELLNWLTQPIGGLQALQAIEVTEPLGVAMRVALLAGFAISLPYIAFELYLFAAPGLKARARRRGLAGVVGDGLGGSRLGLPQGHPPPADDEALPSLETEGDGEITGPVLRRRHADSPQEDRRGSGERRLLLTTQSPPGPPSPARAGADQATCLLTVRATL
jgi:hypothetical protein